MSSDTARRASSGVAPLPSPAAEAVEAEGRSFTVRGVLAGLAIGLVICFSNMYFGLQTGWVSTMTMPASLLGFGFFKMVSRHLAFPFSPVENVLVQSVAGGLAIMPLGCGYVGVLPAMNYLLAPDEHGPLRLGLPQLMVWSLGLCYFGVVFAVPLVIIREKLKFPSGFSTAVLIGVLHGRPRDIEPGSVPADFASLAPVPLRAAERDEQAAAGPGSQDWKRNVRLLLSAFLVSGLLTFGTYFVPGLRNIPILGTVAAEAWLWTLNPSLAYVGQGVIMGPATTLHMLLGAVVGWGVLSPLSRYQGWAPGPVDDWETGSKGWLVWTSLAIMLADALASLGHVLLRAAHPHLSPPLAAVGARLQASPLAPWLWKRDKGYTALIAADDTPDIVGQPASPSSDLAADARADEDVDAETTATGDTDAPPDQQVANKTVLVGLFLSVVFCVFCIDFVFGDLVPLYATVSAVFVALLLSVLGVRALGETDLNPVSGISKLAQLFFALIVPQSKSAVLVNLVAGAVSEAGALQSGDLMQDLKTGHLLGAAPKAQFWGQLIGATVGALASSLIYRLYTTVYEIPGDLFQVPTGYVWIFTARLVTGKGLPRLAKEFAIGFGLLFGALTAVRIYAANKRWCPLVPGGIAVAIGMYNTPSFTLSRTLGGLLAWYWRRRLGWGDTPLIVLASGFILGEGFLSIINLIMQSAGVPHL